MAKVMADAQLSAYSWHLSFLPSFRITCAQCQDRLSIPLTGDTDSLVFVVSEWQEGDAFMGEKRKKGRDADHEMTARELKLSTGIRLTFP